MFATFEVPSIIFPCPFWCSLWTSASRLPNALSCCHMIGWLERCANKQLNLIKTPLGAWFWQTQQSYDLSLACCHFRGSGVEKSRCLRQWLLWIYALIFFLNTQDRLPGPQTKPELVSTSPFWRCCCLSERRFGFSLVFHTFIESSFLLFPGVEVRWNFYIYVKKNYVILTNQ